MARAGCGDGGWRADGWRCRGADCLNRRGLQLPSGYRGDLERQDEDEVDRPRRRQKRADEQKRRDADRMMIQRRGCVEWPLRSHSFTSQLRPPRLSCPLCTRRTCRSARRKLRLCDHDLMRISHLLRLWLAHVYTEVPVFFLVVVLSHARSKRKRDRLVLRHPEAAAAVVEKGEQTSRRVSDESGRTCVEEQWTAAKWSAERVKQRAC